MKDDVISRQAAADIVDFECGEWRGLAKTIINKLEALPSVQPKPCEDAVSRQTAIDALGERPMVWMDSDYEIGGANAMSDLIDRQAAIAVLHMDTSIIPYKKAREYADITISEVRNRIEQLPSAQPEQRWIPVTERLPEDEYVLISKKPSKITGSKWSVDIAIRTADPRSGKIQWRDIGFGVIQDDKVLAWMPLPKPYREEGEQNAD